MILVKFSLKRLLNSNVHLSLSSRRWNNYVKSLISFKYRDFYFIDLIKTMFNLKLVIFFVSYLIKNRGNILLLGSDVSPSGLNFILPANDISKHSVLLFVQLLKFSILKGIKMEKIIFYGLLKKFCYLFFIKQLLIVIK